MTDFEKEFKALLGNDAIDIFDSETETEESSYDIPNLFGNEFNFKKINVDIVMCIDVTASMKSTIDTIKGMASSFYDDYVTLFAMKRKKFNNFRVKVIAFRDYYSDGQFAMAESQFFSLPDETAGFCEYISELKAEGGGDGPVSALEAFSLAMKSDWVRATSADEQARNIIMLFTDAPAHPFEKAEGGVSEFYPDNMFTSFYELVNLWEGPYGIGDVNLKEEYLMDPNAKRVVIYAPFDLYPWNEILFMTQVRTISIESGNGGRELSRQRILDDTVGGIK